MGLKLFNDDETQNGDISKIEINKDYACRYEYNKKREDLQRLEEMKKKGLIESSSSEGGEDNESSESSSSDDEDDFHFFHSKEKDLEFFNALIKVRNQDPSLRQKDVTLFQFDDSDESEGEESDDIKNENDLERKKKTMYLKDVVAKQLIEEGPDFDDSKSRDKKSEQKSYSEEQEEIRREFLKAADEVDNDGDGDFLRAKEKQEYHGNNNDSGMFEEKLNEYFGQEDGGLDDNSKFLKEFFMNKLWVDKDGKSKGVLDDTELDDLLRDEEEVEKQEQYEYETNFRYEENAGDRVLGHSRLVEGSVRKKTNARKEQRKSKEERMQIAEMERKEELKHLKNLKKQEMEEKLRKIREISGIGEEELFPFKEADLEDDFDPEEYDRVMKAAFDEKYYDADDTDPTFVDNEDEGEVDVEKPDFEKEDELLGLPKDWDVCGNGDGFLALRDRILSEKVDEEGNGESNEEEDVTEGMKEQNDVEASEEGKRKRRRKVSLLEKAREAMMDEIYKLDYEDTIGDLKTRFKYTKVDPNRYGLKAEEILVLDDKDLNQYVSLKKLAPYREREYKVPNSKRYQQKMKIKELLRKKESDGQKIGKRKKRRTKEDACVSIKTASNVDDGKAGKEGLKSNDGIGILSRKAKRRRRQTELKLSHSRLMAYGKIASKAKRK